jgi:hypothetical protein
MTTPPPTGGPQVSPDQPRHNQREATHLDRHGAAWLDVDYAQLVTGLRAGTSVADLADLLHRGTGAVRSRLRWLIPITDRIPAGTRESWLRTALNDPNYDWRAAVRAHTEYDGGTYFDHNDDDLLIQGWRDQRPLADMAADLGLYEMQVARHLIESRLAVTITDVAAHCRASADGSVDRRVRQAQDVAAAANWILIVDGLPHHRADPHLGTSRHVSTHGSDEEAGFALQTLLNHHLREAEPTVQITWTIAERTSGEGTTGTVRHDALLPLPPASSAHQHSGGDDDGLVT